MAFEYFLYSTDYNNTLIDRSATSFAPLPPNTGEIFIDFLIPKTQPLFLYRESGSTIILNDQTTINNYLNNTYPPSSGDGVDYGTFTGYTATTDTEITTVRNTANYALTTGIISGFTMSINSGDNTMFDIGSGFGYIVNFEPDPRNPIVTEVEYSGVTGITPTGLTTQRVTYIGIDINYNVVQSLTQFTSEQKKQFIFIGEILHINLTNINGFSTTPILAYNVNGRFDDFIDTFSIYKNKDQGNEIIPSASTLTFTKTSGYIFKKSSNYVNNPITPDITFIDEASPAEFNYITSAGIVDLTVRTEIDPTQYEDVNTNNLSGITGNSNQATIQRIYLFSDGRIYIFRGQKVYESINDALDNILIDQKTWVTDQATIDDALLIGVFTIRVSADNLATNRDAIFFDVDRFGTIVGASANISLSKYQIIKDLGGFPTPDSGGTINLQDSNEYKIDGFINISPYKIKFGNNSIIKGEDASKDGIITTTPDALFNAEGDSMVINDISTLNLNPSGRIFNAVGDGLRNQNIFITRAFLQNTRFGNIYNYDVVVITDCAMYDCYDGIKVSGSSTSNNLMKFKVDGNLIDFPRAGFTGIEVYNSSFRKILIENNSFFLTGGTTGVTCPAGIDIVTGILSLNEFVGISSQTGFDKIAGGFNKGELQWEFRTNTGLDNSLKLAFLRFSNNSTATTIPNTTAYVKAAGTNFSTQFERFNTGGANNRIQYSGGTLSPTADANIIVTGDLTVAQNNQVVRVAVYLNGTTNLFEREIRTLSSGEPATFAVNGLRTINDGDYLEVFVRNVTQARDITLKNMEFKVVE